MYLTDFKDELNSNNHNNDDIYLICQFFIHKNTKRYEEIKYCLKQNIELGLFKVIILLNERIYTKNELGLNDDEMKHVKQININKRLSYIDIFIQVKKLNLDGYIVFCNSDIFFDNTINNVRKSCISQSKSLYTLLRFEYTNTNLNKCKLFNHPRTIKPRNDSQDVWIYHTKQLILDNQLIRDLNFNLGVPGCDNKITYIFTKLGYRCINEPYNVRTYHYHSTNIRNYTVKDVVKPPYLFVKPILR